MSKLRLSLACWDYDRTRALADGRVQPDGIDLNYLSLPVEETFFRMLRHREFDVAELSLSSYSVSVARGDSPFVAIPVFPSRFFRHSCIFVSAKSGIREPKDLVGKRIGVPEYQMTAPVWIRGILQDEYGVDPSSVEYLSGGEEEPGREEKLKLDLPPRIKLRPIGPDQTLSKMLADGEIDALYTARAPSTFYSRPDDVRRLFPNFVEEERAYFRKTNIFPIMHVIAIRREVYEANRWIARSLLKAFEASQRVTYDDLMITAALKTMLPWQIASVEDTIREMGPNWWSYGFEPNRAVLDTFLRHHHEQGLSARQLTPEELFAPETFEAFRI
ncbi:MAG: ABC transporter substrate-binding protein [Pseudomonadota bacterium]|uniref:ABC transporter substrate-binding protein n=1 Tax=unclassified Phenylobacterium TaxID=2640670 RepID=UPI0006FCFE63|nr:MULTISPECIES: ABC transporter substrate-binding protein [unclassified Phenylobacterium]KRB40999.1 4,5-dihydroxyphthalate decarboxylase [Phenylobacterium sp. Root700]MBT9470174.1 ABC transporter substrate-binding protein [Phenylobacterium sp.]